MLQSAFVLSNLLNNFFIEQRLLFSTSLEVFDDKDIRLVEVCSQKYSSKRFNAPLSSSESDNQVQIWRHSSALLIATQLQLARSRPLGIGRIYYFASSTILYHRTLQRWPVLRRSKSIIYNIPSNVKDIEKTQDARQNNYVRVAP